MPHSESLTEAAIVPDVFTSGLGCIEDVGGGCLRFTFYAYQNSLLLKDRRREKVVVARIVMPAAAVKESAMAALFAVEGVEAVIGNMKVERRERGH